MFYVSQPLGAVFAYDGDEHFHLVGMAVDADGVVTITLGADDLAADKDDYGPYYLMETDEVIAKFAITPTNAMLPKSLLTGAQDSASVNLDEAIDVELTIVALTGGTFTATPASSDENVFTVAVDGTTMTITPVGEGTATLTLTIADSEEVYGDAVFLTEITVAARDLEFDQVDDQMADAGAAAVDIELHTTGFKNVLDAVEAYSSDDEILAVTYADDETDAMVGTITCTPHATQKGEVTVTVFGTDATAANAGSGATMEFKFRVK